MNKATKQIFNFPNYFITPDGKIYSTNRNRFLKPDVANKYERVTLCKDGKTYHKYVHRLMLETFVAPCPKEMECRHLDSNKLNNKLFNLCWGTKKENGKDSVLHGNHKGIKNGAAKLSESDVRFIIYLYKTGLFSHRQLAKYIGISKTSVGDILRKKTWKHIWTTNKT